MSSSSSGSWVQRTQTYVSFKWSCLLLMMYPRLFSKTVSTEREGCALSSYIMSIFICACKSRATENSLLSTVCTYVHAFNFIMNPPAPSSLSSTVSKVDCWTRMISRSVLRVRVWVFTTFTTDDWECSEASWKGNDKPTLAAVLIKTRESSTSTTRPPAPAPPWLNEMSFAARNYGEFNQATTHWHCGA